MPFQSIVSFAFSQGSLVAAPATTATCGPLLLRSIASPQRLVTSSPTSLAAVDAIYAPNPGKLMDCSATAISFFTSIRIPAALIAGSSLATMFTYTDDNDDDNEAKPPTRLQNRVMVLYHLMALLGFLLSLNVVLTATSTSTALLLGMRNPMAHSTYQLLRREMDYAFTTTRWSFFMAIFSFLTSVTGRVLVEFRLLRRKRFRTASLVICAITSFMLHLLSVANESLISWPHLGAMTIDVIRLSWKQARTHTMEAVSACFGVLATFMGGWAWIKTKGFGDLDLNDDNANNTADDNDDMDADDDESLLESSLDASPPPMS